MNILGTEIPQLVFIFALLAVGLGVAVVIGVVWQALVLDQDLIGAKAAGVAGADVTLYLKRNSPFADRLRELLGSDVTKSRVSADTLAVLARDALEETAQALTDQLRYWSYTPLLAGLCGTVLGLMSLLRADPDTMQQHLAGVLFGTLCGTASALVASSAVAWLDARAIMCMRAARTLLFDKLLPSIPDRKIGIAIEETLLNIIAERTEALVADITSSLTPLAESLREHARQSAEAANQASRAFDVAARAVEEAPVLAQIVAQITKASANVKTASGRLAADAQQLATLYESENNAVKSVELASKSLVDAVGKLSESTEAIRVGVVAGPLSLTGAVQSVDTETKSLSEQVSHVVKRLSELDQELIGLSDELKHFGSSQVETLGKRMENQATRLVEAVREQLEGTPGKTSEALKQVGNDAHTLAGKIRGATASIQELEERSGALITFVNTRIQALASTNPVTVVTRVESGEKADRTGLIDDAILKQTAASLVESASALREILNSIRAENERKRRPTAWQRAWQRIRGRQDEEQ